MPKFVLDNPLIQINSVDLSNEAKQVTINYEREEQDGTGFGDGTRGTKLGLKNWSIDIEFHQNFDAAKVDATLWSLIDNATEFDVLIRADAGAVSTTNPQYHTTSAVLPSYSPLSGSVGDMAAAQVTLKPGLNATLARETA